MAAPQLQLGGRLLQPLQGEAGAEQAGAPQLRGQTGVEVPVAVAVAAGQGVGRQQLGAEVELEQGACQAVLQQGFPQQATAGPQVGRRAAGQCPPAAPGQQVGQPPGHGSLQAGVLPVGLGAPPEALPHPGREGGLGTGRRRDGGQRRSIHAVRSASSGVFSRQWPASG